MDGIRRGREGVRNNTQILKMEAAAKKHFVLVHGVCHGAWYWYRVVTLLESGGHRVTALDLSACGIDPRSLDDVPTFVEYSRPLMDFMGSLSEREKIILVGHSFGGVSVGLAMEHFPEKIEVAVFLTAFMPLPNFPPSHVIQEVMPLKIKIKSFP